MSKKEDVGVLFTKLNDAIDAEDYDKAVDLCDQILLQVPRDIDALQCKCTALIKKSEFNAALKVLDSVPDLAAKFYFERAYILYRMRQNTKALEVLRLVPDNLKDEGFRHLEAQINYQAGNYAQSADIYERHFVDSKEIDAEVKSNICAAFVSSEQSQKIFQFLSQTQTDPEESYELCYNVACAYIDSGDLQAAKQRLEVALKMCEEMLREGGVSEEDLVDETASLQVQYAYVMHLLHQTDAASQLYQRVLTAKPSDTSVVAAASNNLISLRSGAEKIFDSLKKSDKAAHLATEDPRLSLRQKKTILVNRCLLFLQAKQLEKCREELAVLDREMPDSEWPTLIRAAILLRDKSFQQAIQLLADYIANHPSSSTQTQLMLAQVRLGQNDLPSAVSLLESLVQGPALQYRPALVASLVTLYDRLNNHAAAFALFEKAIQYWTRNQSRSCDHQLVFALQQAYAQYQASHGQHAQALALLESIASSPNNKKDAGVLCQLILTACKVDQSLVDRYQPRLPPLPSLQQLRVSVTEQQLDLSPLPFPLPDAKGKRAAAAQSSSSVSEKVKKKRKRKIRYPKNFDPTRNNPQPDPERWLPKYERSYYRKGKGKKGAVMKGSQGAISRDVPAPKKKGAEAAEVKEEKKPEVKSQQQQQQQQQQPQAGKKKGKGRR